MMILISILIGLLAAFIGSLVGLGGGIILVPSLLFLGTTTEMFSWVTPQVIVGVSLMAMMFNGLASTIGYLQLKRVDIKTGLLFLSGSIPGSFAGAKLNVFIDTNHFSLYLGLLMIVIFILLFIDRDKLSSGKTLKLSERTRTFKIGQEVYQYNVHPFPAFILSFVVGLISSLFGISGGSIIVPSMILFFGIPVEIAIGTSMFMIFFISLISAMTHAFLGHMMWKYVAFFMIGAYLGGFFGSKIGPRLKGNFLVWLLRIIVLIAAIRLIVDGLR